MNILLVTSWDEPCGIAEHAAYLKAAVEAADPEMHLLPDAAALAPALANPGRQDARIIHLNWQAALHSRWHPEHIRSLQAAGFKVLATIHDSGVPNSDQCKAICAAADYFIVHEPYDDLPAHGEYLRMGVPGWQTPLTMEQNEGNKRYMQTYWATTWAGYRPVLGSIGFPFGHKNFTELARITGQCGWALLLIAPTATADQIAEWRGLNPSLLVRTDFAPRDDAVGLLAGCDATAFVYVTHGTGQSGAILQGIAARKPVIALSTCRQFRALFADTLGCTAINWCESFDAVVFCLRHTIPIERVHPAIVALAEQESWTKVGQRYAQIYKELVK